MSCSDDFLKVEDYTEGNILKYGWNLKKQDSHKEVQG